MSRTDIHRPLRALWLDPSMREHFKEHHDHRDGICDLDAFMSAFLAGDPVRTGCYLQWWSDQRICSCEMCSQRSGRKRIRRQQRHDTRQALRDVAAQAAADDLDEDSPAIRRASAW